MSKILINEMTFYYAQYFNPVFEQVNLNLDTDWRLGLIGRNGRGKTTFLKLLQGGLKPVSGNITKSITMEYYPYQYQTDYVNTLDVIKEMIGGFKTMEEQMENLVCNPTRENMVKYGAIQEKYEEMGGYQIEGKIKKELYLMGLKEELLTREFQVLSGGEKNKMLMLSLFLRPNAFVLLDEPANHLDIRGKQAIARYLKQKNGFLAVSHDRQFLDEAVDHILAINKTDITLEKGNYSSWKENTEKIEAFEFRTKARLEKEITDLEKGAKVRRSWADMAEKEKNPYKTNNRGNGSRAAKFMAQAKTAELEAIRDIDKKKELLKNYETIPQLNLFMTENTEKPGEEPLLIKVDKLSFQYGKNILFKDFSMSLVMGERIWLKGANGCGKSTLLKLLGGQMESECIKHQETLKTAAAYQEPLWQEGYARDRFHGSEKWEKFINLCSSLEITEALLKRPIETYSSGEKKKVDVARALCEESNILLLDEPLNYMDIYFREQLEKAVLAFLPTMVFVEHDERFGRQVSTRTINLDRLCY